MKNITVGIPRGLFYYRYKHILTSFFKNLEVNILISPYTDEEIINNGKTINNRVCTLLQIFFGHVHYLIDKVDYILITTIKSNHCYYYNCIYDLINNLFNVNIIDFNIEDDSEEEIFINIGTQLGFNKQDAINAYKSAKKEEYKQRKINYLLEQKRLKKDSLKVLIIGEDYIYFDEYIKNNIIGLNNYKNVEFFYSNIINPDIKSYKKAIFSNIKQIKKHVDKTIYISTNPCVLKNMIINDNLVINIDDKNVKKDIYNYINDKEIN